MSQLLEAIDNLTLGGVILLLLNWFFSLRSIFCHFCRGFLWGCLFGCFFCFSRCFRINRRFFCYFCWSFLYRSSRSLLCRSFCGNFIFNGSFNYFVFFQLCLLVEDVFLRVHHFTDF